MRSRFLRSCRPLRARPTVGPGAVDGQRGYPPIPPRTRVGVSTRCRGLWTSCGRSRLSRPSRTSRPWAATRSSPRAQLGVAVVAARPDRRRRRPPASSSSAPPRSDGPQRRGRRPRTGTCRACPSAESRARVQSRQNGCGDRRDDAELAARRRGSASGPATSPRYDGSAGSIGQRSPDRRDQVLGRDDLVEPPAVRMADVHVLDEAQDHARSRAPSAAIGTMLVSLMPRRTTMLTLTGASPASHRGVDAVEHPRDREVDPVHRAEDGVVERVEADRDPPQPGLGERPGQRAQGRAVRRQRQVERARRRAAGCAASIAIRSGRSRRTSGSPPVIRSFSTPSPTNGAGHPVDLLERQDLVARQELVVPAEDLLGHAVGAAEVAAVGDRDAQVAHRPAERVGHARAPVEGRRLVHRHIVPRVDAWSADATVREVRRRRRYHRRTPLVPLANCTALTTAATMRSTSRMSGPLGRHPDRRHIDNSNERGLLIHGHDRHANLDSGFPGPPTAVKPIRTSAPAEATTQSGDPVAEETDAAAMIDVEPATADQVETTGTADLEPAQTHGTSASADAAAESTPAAESAPAADGAAAERPPARSATGTRKPTKFMADLTKAMQADRRGRPRRDHGALRRRGEGRQSRRSTPTPPTRSPSSAATRRRRRRRDPRLVQGRDRPDPRGDRDQDRRAQDRPRGRARSACRRRRAPRRARQRRGRAPSRPEMATFFERLLAEEDPSRIATMAERIPEPPEPGRQQPLTITRRSPTSVAAPEAPGRRGRAGRGVRGRRRDPGRRGRRRAGRPGRRRRGRRGRGAVEADDPRLSMLGATPDFDAAEAEAAMSAAEAEVASETPDDIPAIAEEVVAARLAGLVPPSEGNPEQQTARVVVTGLVSVASIANFKRGLARIERRRCGRRDLRPGRRVRLHRQPRRRHRPQGRAITGLPGFDAKITERERRWLRGRRARPRRARLSAVDHREEPHVTRPAVVVALPPAESDPVVAELRGGWLRGRRGPFARATSRRVLGDPAGRRRRHPRRRDRLRRIAASTDAALHDAARHDPGADGRVAADSFERWTEQLDDGADNEYFTRPYSADSIRWRVEAMCIRARPSTTAAGRSSRAAATWAWTAGTGRATVIAVFNPKGGVGKTTIATNLAVGPPDAQGQVGPAHRRRHRDRPRHDLARPSRPSGRVADSWRDEAEGGPPEALHRHRLGARLRHAGRRPDRFAAPHRRARSGPGRGRDHRRPGLLRRHRHRPAPVVQHAQPGDLRRGRPDPRAGHPGRAGASAPPSSCATSRSPSAAASAWRWSSTAPTAASRSPTWSGPSGCRRSP